MMPSNQTSQLKKPLIYVFMLKRTFSWSKKFGYHYLDSWHSIFSQFLVYNEESHRSINNKKRIRTESVFFS